MNPIPFPILLPRYSMQRGNSLHRSIQTGATLVEFVVVVPTLLFLLMNLIQRA